MEYKYKKIFDELFLDNCPPTSYQPIAKQPYRWVFEKDNSDNFTPQYLKKPARFQSKSEAEKCSALALSFFETKEQAISRFLFLKQSMGDKVYEELGLFTACLQIEQNDGIAEEPNKTGHFNFHPAEGTSLESKIIDREKL